MDLKLGQIEQLEEIVHMNHEIFKGVYEQEPYSLEQYKKRIEGKDLTIYLAYMPDKKGKQTLAGNLIAYPEKEGLYLWILAVKQEFRRMSIGHKLVAMLESDAMNQNLKFISTKVYNVSRSMQRVILDRGFYVDKIDRAKNPKYHALHYRLELDEDKRWFAV